MAIHRLNHAVLYVRNVDRSVAFYRDVLDFRPIEEMASLRGAAFMRAPGSTNDHDLGLFEIGDGAGDSAGSCPPMHSSRRRSRAGFVSRPGTWLVRRPVMGPRLRAESASAGRPRFAELPGRPKVRV